jgi:hypothetical protein
VRDTEMAGEAVVLLPKHVCARRAVDKNEFLEEKSSIKGLGNISRGVSGGTGHMFSTSTFRRVIFPES